MFFFFFDFGHAMKVDEIVSKGTLNLGAYSNIECANVRIGGKMQRVVSKESFLGIIGLTPSARKAIEALCKFIEHPINKTAKTDGIMKKIREGYVLEDGSKERLYIEYSAITDFCRMILTIRRMKRWDARFEDYANNCERFMLGLADVGLSALIDEATGYDKIKKHHEYIEQFKAFIRNEHSAWVKEFQDGFFDGIYKVYNLERKPIGNKSQHPPFFGQFIAKYVYVPLANSNGAILTMLRDKDPCVSKGKRRYKLHQFLTEEIGKPALRAHLISIETLLSVSKDRYAFQRLFYKRYPRPKEQLEFDFDEI